LHPLAGEQKQSGRNFRKAVPPILMAGDGLHDLFTVFTFKTPPSGDFVYYQEDFVFYREQIGRAGSLSPPWRARRSRPTATFSARRAELDLQASPGVRLLNDTLGAIPRKNSRADCCKSHQRFANARANTAPL